jgi:transcription initiation factor TFIID subunit 6
MRHSKRSTMLPCDINHALQALNIEPLYGHLPIPSSSRPTFAPLRIPGDSSSSSKSKAASNNPNSTTNASSDQQFYFLQDQEINFQSLLKEKPPGLVGGGVRWTAHWLAVEGVMPKVPENVAPVRQNPALTGAGGARAAGAGDRGVGDVLGGALQSKPNLSQELQLYYSRLTKALLPDSAGAAGLSVGGGELSSVERARLAALASLRGDTGLQGLIVYLVRWIGEKVRLSHDSSRDLRVPTDS